MADQLTQSLQRRAAFGANFVDGATNLSQRRRYQEDIEAAGAAEEQAGQQQLNRAMTRAELADPMKARRLRLDEKKLETSASQFDARLSAEESRFQTKLMLDQEAMSLRQRQAEIAERKELRSVMDARRVVENTEAVEDHDFKLRSEGILPGSSQYAQAMVEQVIRNPYIAPDYRKTILQQANVDIDPEEVMKQWAAKGRKPSLTVTINPDGKETFRITDAAEKENPDKQRRELEKEWKDLMGNTNSADPAMRPYWKKRAETVGKQLMEFDNKPAAAPGAPATAAPAAPKPIDPARAAQLKSFLGIK